MHSKPEINHNGAAPEQAAIFLFEKGVITCRRNGEEIRERDWPVLTEEQEEELRRSGSLTLGEIAKVTVYPSQTLTAEYGFAVYSVDTADVPKIGYMAGAQVMPIKDGSRPVVTIQRGSVAESFIRVHGVAANLLEKKRLAKPDTALLSLDEARWRVSALTNKVKEAKSKRSTAAGSLLDAEKKVKLHRAEVERQNAILDSLRKEAHTMAVSGLYDAIINGKNHLINLSRDV